MRTTLDKSINGLVDAIASDLAGIVLRTAMEAVQTALGGGRAVGASAPTARPTDSTVLGYVMQIAYKGDRPGASVVEIARGLRVPTDSVKPAVARLVRARRLRKTGNRRGSRYHPKW